ncbi:hypothetical protein ACFSJ3_15430 [Corallincola platygyrae]|uniref:Lipoprotein n=1 Tax=Corallincola platygyrae TaxID=1193278 RepID=A0ABW4XQF4_9GAMM
MGLIKTLVTATSLALLSACASDADIESANVDSSNHETLVAASVKVEGVYFSAISTGCSSTKSFMLDVVSIDADSADLAVIRIEPDRCKRVPFVDSFTLPLPAAVKGLSIQVVNPIDPALKGGKGKPSRTK